MRSKTFKAKYNGKCIKTGLKIVAGDLICMENGGAILIQSMNSPKVMVQVNDDVVTRKNPLGLTWKNDPYYDLWYMDNEGFDGERRPCESDYQYFCNKCRDRFVLRIESNGGIKSYQEDLGY